VFIRRKNNLAPFVVKSVKKMKKFFLGFFFIREKLNIVHNQNIILSILFLKVVYIVCLDGILNSIICQAQLKEKTPTLSEVRGLIKNSIKPKRIAPTEDIVKAIAGFYNVDSENIYKKTRKKEIVKPRQLIMYILREDYSMPYPTIGQKLGGRDHTTVIHSYEKIKRELKENSGLVQEVDQIRAML